MKKFWGIFHLIIIITLALSCHQSNDKSGLIPSDVVNNPNSASGNKSNQGLAVIRFINDEHDFGKVIQGEKVTYAFQFENTGNGDLIISNVSASCGCTSPSFTGEPVKPGKSGVVKVTFDSSNRRGFQNKTVTVVSNTQPNSKVLQIKAMVVVADKN